MLQIKKCMLKKMSQWLAILFGSLLNQFWSKSCDLELVRKPRCYSFLHKQVILPDYVRRSHQSDLLKTSKHWNIFLSHCKVLSPSMSNLPSAVYKLVGSHLRINSWWASQLASGLWPGVQPLSIVSRTSRTAVLMINSQTSVLRPTTMLHIAPSRMIICAMTSK